MAYLDITKCGSNESKTDASKIENVKIMGKTKILVCHFIMWIISAGLTKKKQICCNGNFFSKVNLVLFLIAMKAFSFVLSKMCS
jgi:hypothetical protein